MKLTKKGYRKRLIDKEIEENLEIFGAISIEGLKWCGKTWTALNHSKSVAFLNNTEDNFREKHLAEMDVNLVLDKEKTETIDEWQEVPEIWDAVRFKCDQDNEKGKYILTGSATPVSDKIHHSGAGRICKMKMYTMSLYESGDSSGNISLKKLCNGNLGMQMLKETPLVKIAEFIVRGGFPENITVDSQKAHLMPRAYMDSVIEENLNNLDDGVEYNKHKAQLLLRSLARNESTTVSDASLLKDIIDQDNESMSRNTIAKYLEALNRLFLFNNQAPFSPNLRSSLRVKQAEKRHFSDPAMACALLNITADKLLGDLNTFGFLFEALVEHNLAIYAQSFGAKLFHYQDYKNNEIDAVIELEDGDWCAFEIKLGANKIDEGAASLLKTCADIVDNGGKAPKIMCVICGLSNAAYQRPDGVYVVPITALKD